ncbi:MAG: hypothetical protein GW809_08790 [Bacteroidetes bacterium]|nr:hypothetical protein [Bacteroidota bacterium]
MFLFDLGLVLRKLQQEVKNWLEWILDPSSSENDSEGVLIPIPVIQNKSHKTKSMFSFWGNCI